MAAPLTLLDPTPADDDFFGSAVTFAGGQLLVGARFDDTAADDAGAAYLLDPVTGALGAGAAYLFDAATGVLAHTLPSPTPQDYDLFGNAVAAAGGIVVVGAPFDDTTKPNAGSAYVFDAATGALRHTLQAPHPREGDLFGSAVAASDTTIVVGAPFDDTVAANAGAVHLFDAATGALLHTLLNPASDVDSRFGSAVAIAGGTVLVGEHDGDAAPVDRHDHLRHAQQQRARRDHDHHHEHRDHPRVARRRLRHGVRRPRSVHARRVRRGRLHPHARDRLRRRRLPARHARHGPSRPPAPRPRRPPHGAGAPASGGAGAASRRRGAHGPACRSEAPARGACAGALRGHGPSLDAVREDRPRGGGQRAGARRRRDAAAAGTAGRRPIGTTNEPSQLSPSSWSFRSH